MALALQPAGTDEAELQRERTARQQAERRARSKDELLVALVHELRTRLNAIGGWAHLLDSSPDDATRTRAVEVIRRNVILQSRLLADVLDMQRLEAGTLDLSLTAVDPAEVAQAALSGLAAEASRRGVRLDRDLPSVSPLLRGDRERLQQVLGHLVSNAIRVTTEGGAVSLALAAEHGEIVFVVKDDGPGIDPELLPGLLERRRTPRPEGRGGLGLGLGIARGVVELHGGRLDAANRTDGPGAVFTVRLPAADRPAQA